MSFRRESFCFAKVSSLAAADAFRFHTTVAAADPHIWPRAPAEIQQYADEGSLFGVRRCETGEFVAIAYAVLDERTSTWEIGGVTVDNSVQNCGIGMLLARFALAHTMVYEQPWQHGLTVVAHVHQANFKPMNLLLKLGFELSGPIEVPEHLAPASMQRNQEGKIVGYEFRFTRAGLRQLSQWFDEEFYRSLRRSGVDMKFDLGPSTIDRLVESLHQMAREACD